MKAATRVRTISITALVLVISIAFLVPKVAAQSDKYSEMAPVEQYVLKTPHIHSRYHLKNFTEQDARKKINLVGFDDRS